MIDLNAGVNLITGVLVKILFGLVTMMALLMMKQASLMNRVVDIPVGGWFRGMTGAFFVLCLLLTALVVLLV